MFILSMLLVFSSGASAFATGGLDSLGDGSSSTSETNDEADRVNDLIDELNSTGNSPQVEVQVPDSRNAPQEQIVEGPGNPDNVSPGLDIDVQKNENNIGNQLKNQKYVDSDHIAYAQQSLSPFINIIGIIIGWIIVASMALYVLVTALDIVYIAFPPIRQYLANPQANGAGGSLAGGFGGVGMPGGFGRPQPAMSGGTGRQWVSDAAVAAVSLYGGAAPAQGQQMMSPMGGPMGTPAQNQQQGKKNVFLEYLKKRTLSTVLFVFALVFLTSSLLMDVGLNIAQWGLGVLNWLNSFL